MVGWVEELVEAAERHISVMQVTFLVSDDAPPILRSLESDHRRIFSDARRKRITSVILHTNHVEVAGQFSLQGHGN